MKKWYEHNSARNWFQNEITEADYLDGYKIMCDVDFLELAIYYTTLIEGCRTYTQCRKREKEILACDEECTLAVCLLMYHKIDSFEELQIKIIKYLHKLACGKELTTSEYLEKIREVALDDNLMVKAISLLLSHESGLPSNEFTSLIKEVNDSPVLIHKAIEQYLSYQGIYDELSPDDSRHYPKSKKDFPQGEYHE